MVVLLFEDLIVFNPIASQYKDRISQISLANEH